MAMIIFIVHLLAAQPHLQHGPILCHRARPFAGRSPSVRPLPVAERVEAQPVEGKGDDGGFGGRACRSRLKSGRYCWRLSMSKRSQSWRPRAIVKKGDWQ